MLAFILGLISRLTFRQRLESVLRVESNAEVGG